MHSAQFFSACRGGRGYTPRSRFSASRAGRGCSPRSFFQPAVRAGVAVRALVFHLAVRAGGAVRAALFPLAVRAGVARHTAVFQPAVRAGGAVRARVLPLPMRAPFPSHHARSDGSPPFFSARHDVRSDTRSEECRSFEETSDGSRKSTKKINVQSIFVHKGRHALSGGVTPCDPHGVLLRLGDLKFREARERLFAGGR